MSVQGVFVAQLVRLGCHINVAQLISRQYPSVWKWFVYKWVNHSGNARQFIRKHLSTAMLQTSFMRKMAKYGLWNIMQWAYNNGCDKIYYFGWTLIYDNALKGKNIHIAGWVRSIQDKRYRDVSFIPSKIYTASMTIEEINDRKIYWNRQKKSNRKN